jgi:hypothetical protein
LCKFRSKLCSQIVHIPLKIVSQKHTFCVVPSNLKAIPEFWKCREILVRKPRSKMVSTTDNLARSGIFVLIHKLYHHLYAATRASGKNPECKNSGGSPNEYKQKKRRRRHSGDSDFAAERNDRRPKSGLEPTSTVDSCVRRSDGTPNFYPFAQSCVTETQCCAVPLQFASDFGIPEIPRNPLPKPP